MGVKLRQLIKEYLSPSLISFAREILSSQKSRVSKRLVRQLVNERQMIYLELGAGRKKGQNGWITLDIAPGCDMYWDLTKGLPFPDNSVHKMYSSHMLEHLAFTEGQSLLAECRRVLVPDGTISICVPNARIYIESYAHGKALDENQYFRYKSAYNKTSGIDSVNYMAYMDGHHKYMFDEENLVVRLEKAGFRNAHIRAFDPNLDLKIRDFESIYAEALK